MITFVIQDALGHVLMEEASEGRWAPRLARVRMKEGGISEEGASGVSWRDRQGRGSFYRKTGWRGRLVRERKMIQGEFWLFTFKQPFT